MPDLEAKIANLEAMLDGMHQIIAGIATDSMRIRHEATGRAVVDIAALSLLLDKGIVTNEEVVQKLQKLHDELEGDPSGYAKSVILQVKQIFSRDIDPKMHGSSDNQQPAYPTAQEPHLKLVYPQAEEPQD